MSFKKIKIKVTSRSFSRHRVLKKELLDIFPNSIFNPNGPTTGLCDLVEFLGGAEGVILGLEKMDSSVLAQLNN